MKKNFCLLISFFAFLSVAFLAPLAADAQDGTVTPPLEEINSYLVQTSVYTMTEGSLDLYPLLHVDGHTFRLCAETKYGPLHWGIPMSFPDDYSGNSWDRPHSSCMGEEIPSDAPHLDQGVNNVQDTHQWVTLYPGNVMITVTVRTALGVDSFGNTVVPEETVPPAVWEDLRTWYFPLVWGLGE